MKRLIKTGFLCFLLLGLFSATLVWAAPAENSVPEEASVEKENEILAEETPGQEQQEVLPSEEWETVGEIQEKEEIPASEPETETEAEEEAETQTEPKEEKIIETAPETGEAPQPETKTTEGWEETKEGLLYRKADGSYLTDTIEKIGKYLFMFDEAGRVKTGWQTVNGQTCYLKKTGAPGVKGAMLLGWQNIGGRTYYFKQSGEKAGAMFTGLQKVGSRKYYFQPEGENPERGSLVTGWQTVNGQDYYLKRTGEKGVKGKALLGWQNIGGQTYYFKQTGEKSGVMFAGLQKVGSRKFYFNPSGSAGEKGRMLTGWRTIGSQIYYLKQTGEKGVKGKSLIGWQNIGGQTYYFQTSGSKMGQMYLGFQKIGSRTFFFKRTGDYGVKGRMLTGWQNIDNQRYYFKKTGAAGVKGAMFVGWQNIGSKQYYFDPDGVYVPGKKKITVAVDAGHQLHGNSSLEPIGPGASERKPKVSSGTYGQWSGLNEYELNLTVAKKLQKELENRGYEVYMIRTTHNVDISNSQRAKNAANAGADILVRIHANSDSSSSVSGALTIAPTNSNPYMTKSNITKSRELSQKVLDGFCSATGAKKRDIWYTDTMSGINWSTIPVTIVEMGFMSNRQDDLNMANASYQNKMVKGMADGIDDYF